MDYIARTIDSELLAWKEDPARKPLLIRGARQVGKTAAVRNLAQYFEHFIEIDFNESKLDRDLFESDISTPKLWENLAVMHGVTNEAGETLLFLDEIQACPAAINRLRYFYEQLPGLHVIAAGSLLEFVLNDLPSFGVGCVRFLFIYPLSFQEFLTAQGKNALGEMILRATPENPLIPAMHETLVELLRTFLVIGGMPEVVRTYAQTKDLLKCQRVLDNLITSYRDDFRKYNKRVPEARINEVFASVAQQGQGKFVYSKVAEGLKAAQVKDALNLLILADLVHPVTHTAANGLPLESEINEKYRRMILMDTGLLQRMLALDLRALLQSEDFNAVNRGAVAEVFVGNELIKAQSNRTPASLYCWHREKPNSQSSVDYVVQSNDAVIPIEVKASGKGAMQSLRVFMKAAKSPYGVRTSLENFSTYENIRVYPLYAIGNLVRPSA